MSEPYTDEQLLSWLDSQGDAACGHYAEAAKRFREFQASARTEPIPLLLWCPECSWRHVDEGEFATKSHHTHACQQCGMVWRPALVPTVGVQFLPGFCEAETRPTPKEPSDV